MKVQLLKDCTYHPSHKPLPSGSLHEATIIGKEVCVESPGGVVMALYPDEFVVVPEQLSLFDE